MPTKTVLITGAADGIGYQLARLFAADGYFLVLVDKSSDGLDRAGAQLKSDYNATSYLMVRDLSDEMAVADIVSELSERRIEIEVLVNNAGFGLYGNYWEYEAAKLRALLQVNIVTPAMLTRHLLPGMVERKRGRILNVASVAAFAASSYATAYYASKAFLLCLSDGVGYGLRGTGVTVTTVCPGPTYTSFNWFDSDGPPLPRSRFQMDASDVAAQAYAGLMQGRAWVVPGFLNKLRVFLARHMPRRWVLAVLRKAQ